MLNENVMDLGSVEENLEDDLFKLDPSAQTAKDYVQGLLEEIKTEENRSTVRLIQNLLFDDNISLVDWRSVWQLLSL